MPAKAARNVFLRTQTPEEAVIAAASVNVGKKLPTFTEPMITIIGTPRYYKYLKAAYKKSVKKPIINPNFFKVEKSLLDFVDEEPKIKKSDIFTSNDSLDDEEEKEIKVSRKLSDLNKMVTIKQLDNSGKTKSRKQKNKELNTIAMKSGLLSDDQTNAIRKARKEKKAEKFRGFELNKKERDLKRYAPKEYIEPTGSLMDYHKKKLDKEANKLPNPLEPHNRKKVFVIDEKKAKKAENKAKSLTMTANKQARRARRQAKRHPEKVAQAEDGEYIEDEELVPSSWRNTIMEFADIAVILYQLTRIDNIQSGIAWAHLSCRLLKVDYLKYASMIMPLVENLTDKLLNKPVNKSATKEFTDEFNVIIDEYDSDFKFDETPLSTADAESGPLDFIDGLMAQLSYLVDSDVAGAIIGIVSLLGSLSVLRNATVENVKHLFGKPKKMTLFAIFVSTVTACLTMVRYSTALLRGDSSFMEILSSTNPLDRMVKRAEYLLLMSDSTYVTVKREGEMSREEWIVEAEQFIANAIEFDSWPHCLTLWKRLRELRNDLNKRITVLKESLQSSRKMPFAIILHGAPGIGKTGIRLALLKACFLKIGHEYSDNDSYVKTMDSDFWDGVNPSQHKVIHLQELANESVSHAQKSMSSLMTSFNRLVDTAPFNANMSEAKDKGTVFLRPTIVFADTNNRSLNLDECMYDPSAIKRRCVFVDVTVKTEYRVTESNAIDFEKSMAAKRDLDSNLLDRYNVSITTYNSKGVRQSKANKHLENGNIFEAISTVSILFSKHVENQETMLSMDDEINRCVQMSLVEEDEVKQAETGEYIDSLSENSDEYEEKDLPVNNLVEESALISSKERKHYSGKNYSFDPDHRDFVNPLFFLWYFLRRLNGALWNVSFYFSTVVLIFLKCAVEEYIRYSSGVSATVGFLVADGYAGNLTAGVFHVILGIISFALGPFASLFLHFVYNLSVQWGLFKNSMYTFMPLDLVYNTANYLFYWSRETLILQFMQFVKTTDLENEYVENNPDIREDLMLKAFYFFSLIFSLFWYGIFFHPLLTMILFSLLFAGLLAMIVSIDYTKMRLLLKMKAGRFGSYYLDQEISRQKQRRDCLFTGIYNKFSIDHLKYAFACGALLTILWKLSKRFSQKIVPESQGEVMNQLQELDDIFDANTGITRIKVKDTNVYNEVQIAQVTCPHRGPIEDLEKSILQNNLFQIGIQFGEKLFISYGLGLCSSYLLVNAHSLRNADKFYFNSHGSKMFKKSDMHSYIQLDSTHIVAENISQDLVIVNVAPFNFKNILKHFADSDSFTKFANGRFRTSKVDIKFCSNMLYKDKDNAEFNVSNGYAYVYKEHARGQCGTPLFAKVGDSASAIVGIHTGGHGEYGYSSAVRLIDVQNLINSIKEEEHLMPIPSEGNLELEFEIPTVKSPMRFLSLPNLNMFGKVAGVPVTFPKKSKQRKAPFADELEGFFKKHFNFERTEEYVPPMMKPKTVIIDEEEEYISPYNENLKKLNNNPPRLNKRIMKKVVKKLTKEIVRVFKKHGIKKLSVLTTEAAINGAEFDDFVRRINASTSGGFGFPGIKSKHLPLIKNSLIREMTPELAAHLLEELNKYRNGETARPIYKGQLKDEVRTKEKVAKGKTRMFYMSPLANLILCRKFMGTFMASMVDFGSELGIQVGIDMHADADKYIKSFGEYTNGIEGDYSGYDVHRSPDLQYMANSVIYGVHEALGYSKVCLRVLSGLLTDDMHPLIMILGDLYCKDGAQMSGKFGTAEQNSIVNLLIMMYCWYINPHTRDLDFFEYVKNMSYGDDLQAGVHQEILDKKWFNNLVFQQLVRENFGMDFTSPSKSMELEEYSDLIKGSFLRRTFRYREDLNKYHAMLDLNSCYKALQWYLPSDNVSPQDQMMGCAISMCWEFYFHVDNRDAFRSIVQDMAEMYVKYNLVPSVLDFTEYMPTYYQIAGRVGDMSVVSDDNLLTHFFNGDEKEAESGPVVAESGYLTENHISSPHDMYSTTPVQQTSHGVLFKRSSEDVEYMLTSSIRELRELEDEKEEFTIEYLNLHPAIQTIPNGRERMKRLCRIADLQETIRVLERTRRKVMARIQAQSGPAEMESMDSMTGERNQVLMDEDGDSPHELKCCTTTYIDNGQYTMYDMDDFLSRPVEIAAFNINVGSEISNRYNVWNLFTLNPSVRSKLRNYAYLHGSLKLRIIVSGTQFHYGRIMVSYQPYAFINANLIALDSCIAMSPLFREGLLTYLSQSREVAVINICNNEPLDMTLPFISTKQAHRLYNTTTSAIADTTPFDDLLDAGQLFVYTMGAVDATTADALPVSVQIYAYMDDVQLGCSTATQIAITTESGEYKEITQGPIEAYASYAGQVTQALESVPFISNFAHAGSIIVGGIKGLSSIFGWSKPVTTQPVRLVKNEPYDNGCLTIGVSTAKRLVMDPQQSLSLGTEAFCIPEDELVLQTLAKKEAYIGNFLWDKDAGIMTNPIFLMRVHPQIGNLVTYGGQRYFFPSPMAFVANWFEKWRGKIRIRMEFVCSSFHRGKVAVYYEPNINQATLINANLSLNKNQMIIVDLQKTQNISFCVEWNAPRPMLNLVRHNQCDLNYQAFSAATAAEGFVNGYVGVVPYTSLTCGNDSFPIRVNVYVCAEEMEYFVPSERNAPSSRAIPAESGPVDGYGYACVDLNTSSANMDHLYDQYYGERVVSFRSLMKRYQPFEDYSFGAGLAGNVAVTQNRFIRPPMQLQYGLSAFPSGISRNMITELQYAFVGIRGGTRRRVRVLTPATNPQMAVTVTVLNGATQTESVAWTTTPASYAISGAVSFIPQTNAGIDFEIPYSNANLFEFAFSTDQYGLLPDNMDELSNRVYRLKSDISSELYTPRVVTAIAAAEDFNLLRFQGTPFYKF